jgi:hypothetical protein
MIDRRSNEGVTMTDTKKQLREELFLLMLIPYAVSLFGFVAVWYRPITLRIMSQFLYFGHNPELARPLAERAVSIHVANNDPLNNEYQFFIYALPSSGTN